MNKPMFETPLDEMKETIKEIEMRYEKAIEELKREKEKRIGETKNMYQKMHSDLYDRH